MGSAGRRRRGGEIGDEGGRGSGEEGVKVEGEILAAAGGTGSGAASDDLVGVGGAEERIEVVSRMRGVGGGLLYFLGQFVILFVSARIRCVSATYQLCISVSALSRS
jgi:hypothetical protein